MQKLINDAMANGVCGTAEIIGETPNDVCGTELFLWKLWKPWNMK